MPGTRRNRAPGPRDTSWTSALLATAALLGGCGGGGGDAAPATPPAPATPTTPAIAYAQGVFPAASTFAAKCAAPRTGTDPQTGRAWPDTAGSVLHEKHWLRSWSNDLYLWYAEITDRDPAATASVLDYFALLKTPVLTASGTPKDHFHFTYTTEEWRQLSQLGSESGYGAEWQLPRTTPPRRAVIAYVEPGSPAATAGLARGTEVLSIDGVDLVNDNTAAGIQTLNRGLSPDATGQTHNFGVKDRNGATRTVALTSATVVSTPVQGTRVLPGGIGYLLFNNHIATAERGLVDAVNALRTGGATELVLDLRYNGGGYLSIANELAYMIGGSRTTGKVFERLQFNAHYPGTDPIIGGALTPQLFLTQTQGFSIASGQVLPTLNLARVVVLTGAGTCSASEAIINGLIGAGVQVIQVGGTTCGKPYGFYPADNCGTTYFSIQFRGTNDAGFGDYADGFAPGRVTGDARANLPGCTASDDFTHDLGDPAENQLAAGLGYLHSGFCTAAAAAPEPASDAASQGLPLGRPSRPWRENRILGLPRGM
jgi:carboxyl-terminal processing protease